MRQLSVFAIATVATAVLAACSGGESPLQFTFTPLPTTTISGWASPVVEVDGEAAVADEVLVTVRTAHAEEFEDWLADTPFSIRGRTNQEVADRIKYVIAVPPGSVTDALVALQAEPSVAAAQLNIIFGVDDP